MVSEAQGKLCLGIIATGMGGVGILVSLLLWSDQSGTVRLLGPLARSLAGVGGASALFSGVGLLHEVGPRMRFNRAPVAANAGLLLVIASLSIFAVVLGVVTYLATVNIQFHLTLFSTFKYEYLVTRG